MSTLRIVNDVGDAFTVKLLRTGDRYGRGGCCVTERPMVEFYDAEYAGKPGFDVEGQFVTRYYVHSMTGNEWGNNPAALRRNGLDLHGGVDKWKVSGENVTAVFDWLLSVMF